MKRILWSRLLFLTMTILLLSGCVTRPLYITLEVDPSVLEAPREPGAGSVNIAIPLPADEVGGGGGQIVGSRIKQGTAVWTKENVSEVVTTALRTGFENRGYKVVDSDPEVTLQVTTNCSVSYGSAGFWGAPVKAHVTMTASLVDEVKQEDVWERQFLGSATQKAVAVDRKGPRQKTLKQALSKALADLFSDESLTKKLGEYR